MVQSGSKFVCAWMVSGGIHPGQHLMDSMHLLINDIMHMAWNADLTQLHYESLFFIKKTSNHVSQDKGLRKHILLGCL